MEAQSVPSRIRKPEPPPSDRRRALSSEKFWALMGRWNVPDDRARSLIGLDRISERTKRAAKPGFQLSDEQAKVLSCLLEIDLTLTLAKVRRLLRPQVAQVNIAESGAQQLNVAQMPARLPTKSPD